MIKDKGDGTETVKSTEPVANTVDESTVETQEPVIIPKTDAAETAETVDTPTEQDTAVKQESVTIPDTEIVKTTETAIIFKATKPLMKEEFELLSDMVKYENEKTGLKIVLMPFSCEISSD